MDTVIQPKEVLLLFDEYGTPTLNSKRENDFFVGVSVLYELKSEDKLFDSADKVLNIYGKAVKKNRNINNDTAIKFAIKIAEHPISITVFYVDLTDDVFAQTIKEYCKAGNFARLNIRAKIEKDKIIKERAICHFIHSQMLFYIFYESISNLLLNDNKPLYNIYPQIDSWAIPNCDKEIKLKDTSKIIERQLNLLLNQTNKIGYVSVKDTMTLDKSLGDVYNYRKKFIDYVTSIVSRLFFNKNNPHFTEEPMNILRDMLNNSFMFKRVNKAIIGFCSKYKEDIIQETKRRMNNLGGYNENH
jgi:hypothetical protein